MIKLLGVVVSLLAVIIMFFNMIGPIASGIWLGILGEWGLIGAGILYLFGSLFLIGLLIAPAMAVVVGVASLSGDQSRVALFLSSVFSLIWTYGVAIGSCVIVLMYCVNAADRSDNLIPFLMWGCTIASAPWSFMAQKEVQSSGSTETAAIMTSFFVGLACIVASVWHYFEPADNWQAWATRFGFVMLAGLFFQVLEVLEMLTRRSRLGI